MSHYSIAPVARTGRMLKEKHSSKEKRRGVSFRNTLKACYKEVFSLSALKPKDFREAETFRPLPFWLAQVLEPAPAWLGHWLL
jgi:hypothetical protein